MRLTPKRRSDGWLFCSEHSDRQHHLSGHTASCDNCEVEGLTDATSDHMNAQEGTKTLCLPCSAKYKEAWASGFFGLMEITGA